MPVVRGNRWSCAKVGICCNQFRGNKTFCGSLDLLLQVEKKFKSYGHGFSNLRTLGHPNQVLMDIQDPVEPASAVNLLQSMLG